MSEVSVILATYLLVKLLLDLFQIHTIRNAPIDTLSAKLLEIDQDDDLASRNYNISKLNVSMIKNTVYVAWIYFLLEGGIVNSLYVFFSSTILNISLLNLCIIISVYILISLTMILFSFYSNFVVEEKYGFNTSSKLLFFKDNLISLLLSTFLLSIVSLIFFYLVFVIYGGY
jgi:STE24 endopeptidase